VIRGFLGLFPDEYKGVQFFHDTWDRADKGIQLYKQYQDFKRVRSIVEGAKATSYFKIRFTHQIMNAIRQKAL
jgi:head-tail adaptor